MSIVTHGQARTTPQVTITNDPPATRPAALPLIVAGLPDDPVMDARQFVGWRWWWDAEKAKWTKPPYRPQDGRNASHSNPADWTSRPRAVASVARHDFDGIGLVLTTAAGIVAVDLDHCHDPRTGTIDPWALAWVEHFASYTEVSPSGAGLRILIRATMPAGGKKHGDTEAYGNARYVTLTGHRRPTSPATIAPRQPQLDAFMLAAFPSAAPAASTPRAPQPVTDDDATLIERARSADDGGQFARLWAGDLADVAGNPSAGDYRLAYRLAFWTGWDQPRIARLMAASGLRRDKWDSPRGETTWLASTIARACANQPDSYATRLGAVTTGGGTPAAAPVAGHDDTPPADAGQIVTDPCRNCARLVAERDDARRERDEARAMLASIMQIRRNKHIRTERDTLTAVTLACDAASVDAEGYAPMPLATLADATGKGTKAVSEHLDRGQAWGLLDKKLVPERYVDRETGEVTVRPTTHVKLLATPRETLSKLLVMQPAPATKHGKTWGGKRETCPACGSENTRMICDDCGHIFNADPAAVAVKMTGTATAHPVSVKMTPLGTVYTGGASSVVTVPSIGQDDRYDARAGDELGGHVVTPPCGDVTDSRPGPPASAPSRIGQDDAYGAPATPARCPVPSCGQRPKPGQAYCAAHLDAAPASLVYVSPDPPARSRAAPLAVQSKRQPCIVCGRSVFIAEGAPLLCEAHRAGYAAAFPASAGDVAAAGG